MVAPVLPQDKNGGRVEHTTEDILSFSKMVSYGLSCTFGKAWTTREMDGLFYNQFLNPKLQYALRNIRQRYIRQAEPPYPWQWDSEAPRKEVVFPGRGDGALLVTPERIDFWELSEQFGVDLQYFENAYFYGTPVPFCRYAMKSHLNERGTSIFRLDIFSSKVANFDWDFIGREYDRWIELPRIGRTKVDTIVVIRGERGPLVNIQGEFEDEGVPHLEILSCPPYASMKAFVLVAKEFFSKQKSGLPGKGKAKLAIRVWTGYLLTEYAGLNHRQAIQETNKHLGQQCGKYNMDEVLEGTGGSSGGVTSSGEIQFSGNRAELEKRIADYGHTLS